MHKDIAIRNFQLIKPDNHTRFDAISRKYIYRISNRKDPFLQYYTAVYYQKLDVDSMNIAAEKLKTT